MVTEAAILGILSLIIWALILIVTVKYVLILLRADNNGEGGTLALMALANRTLGGKSVLIVMLGMISAALFYGDAMITPALSVLSAVEGLKVIAPALGRFVVPLSVVILFALFMVQSHGTARVAIFFGPITLVWFIALAAAGLYHVTLNPTVLAAFNPLYGASFPVEPRLYRPAYARRRVSGSDRRGSALRRSRPFCRRCVELFPAPHRPRGRDRHASHGLIASTAASASGNQAQSCMKRRSHVICRLA